MVKWTLKKDNKYFILLLAIVIILWTSAWILIVVFIPEDETGMGRGVFGDMFGSINSLFSGLALAGIIYTIYLQKRELKLQRNELKQTRGEFKIQNDTLKTQKFENSFFNLVKNHQELMDILPSQKNSNKDEPKVRYAALKEIKRTFEQNLGYTQKVLKTKVIDDTYYLQQGALNQLSTTIDEYKPLANDTLLTLEFIQKSEVLEKELYYKILKNSMSLSESILFGFYTEFFADEIQLEQDVKYKFQYDYFNFTKEPISKTTVLPPIIHKFRHYTQQRNVLIQPPNRIVLKDELMEWSKTVIFGFINVDNQSIAVISLEIRNKMEPLSEVQFDNQIDPNEEFNFSPLTYDNLNLIRLSRNECTTIELLFLLSINCSISGPYIIRYALQLREGYDKGQVNISEHITFNTIQD